MPSQDRTRARQSLPLAAALALLVALAAAPAARADTSGSITVTASVTTELSLALCDAAADFGDGLSSFGAPPRNTGDAIGVTDPSPNLAEGRFYSWTPSCQVEGTGALFQIVSSYAWRLTPCAGVNAGPGASPTLTNRDLSWHVGDAPWTTYADAVAATHEFFRCGDTRFATIGGGGPGTHAYPGFFYLRIDPDDLPGTFSATTTWTLEPD